jgi:branched-chain amino acid transport system permease protein
MTMKKPNSTLWKQALRTGLIGGAVVLLLALVGIIGSFKDRDIIRGWVSMGQILFLAPILLFAINAARRAESLSKIGTIMAGAISGFSSALLVALLPLLGQAINLRAMFANASPELYKILTFGQELLLGVIILLLVGALIGAAGAAMLLIPPRIRKALSQAVVWVILLGLLRELIMVVLSRWGVVAYLFRWLFAQNGLAPIGAVTVFVVVGAVTYWSSGRKRVAVNTLPPQKKRRRMLITIIAAGIILLILPLVLGTFFSEILDTVGLYILMGLGLNIVVGFAGLLDLGYVAFYAIGAYTVGILTSPELGLFHLTYWQAMPFAVVVAVLAGVILGLPVLKMRGDYLAIVTLGFGEIIRILALSDWLKPWLGGSQGIQQIAHPWLGGLEIKNQTQLYYLILVGIAIAIFIAWRLKDSRMGRSWMAIREDEDVAQAMGINLVATKLLAFASGAFFGGLSGTIFATKLTAAYPHSFSLFVSINVLSLIIIGGMGSIPGVVVGSLVLMGSPELLREFAEYRYLVYGALLVVMMLMKPEGLWPEARRRLELHEAEELALGTASQPAPDSARQ